MCASKLPHRGRPPHLSRRRLHPAPAPALIPHRQPRPAAHLPRARRRHRHPPGQRHPAPHPRHRPRRRLVPPPPSPAATQTIAFGPHHPSPHELAAVVLAEQLYPRPSPSAPRPPLPLRPLTSPTKPGVPHISILRCGIPQIRVAPLHAAHFAAWVGVDTAAQTHNHPPVP